MTPVVVPIVFIKRQAEAYFERRQTEAGRKPLDEPRTNLIGFMRDCHRRAEMDAVHINLHQVVDGILI